MGEIANMQCSMCRGNDISKHWNLSNPYFQCNGCGERWK